jgi:ribosome-associated protein
LAVLDTSWGNHIYTDRALDQCEKAWLAAWQKGAEDPVALDVSERLAISDIFLIVTGRSERNAQAIADGVEDDLYLHGYKLHRREGKADGRWVLLDFGELVVHVFHEEERAFYQLEKLWRDCPVVPLSAPEGEPRPEQV